MDESSPASAQFDAKLDRLVAAFSGAFHPFRIVMEFVPLNGKPSACSGAARKAIAFAHLGAVLERSV
jgi:hypothetical protein